MCCIIGRVLQNTKCTHRLYRGMYVKPGYNCTTSCWIHRICRGFTDADGEREFLFALPRFARDEVKTFTACLDQFNVTSLWSNGVDTMLSSFIFNSFYTVSIEHKPLLFAANVVAAQCCELCYSQHRLIPTRSHPTCCHLRYNGKLVLGLGMRLSSASFRLGHSKWDYSFLSWLLSFYMWAGSYYH